MGISPSNFLKKQKIFFLGYRFWFWWLDSFGVDFWPLFKQIMTIKLRKTCQKLTNLHPKFSFPAVLDKCKNSSILEFVYDFWLPSLSCFLFAVWKIRGQLELVILQPQASFLCLEHLNWFFDRQLYLWLVLPKGHKTRQNDISSLVTAQRQLWAKKVKRWRGEPTPLVDISIETHVHKDFTRHENYAIVGTRTFHFCGVYRPKLDIWFYEKTQFCSSFAQFFSMKVSQDMKTMPFVKLVS